MTAAPTPIEDGVDNVIMSKTHRASRAAVIAGGLAAMILTAIPPASAAPQTAVVPRASLGPASAPAPVPVAAAQLLRIAYPATNNTLWGYGDLYGTASLGVTVAANTSPAVVGLPGAGFEIVFQDGNGHLAMAGTASADGSVSAISSREDGALMAPNTSPAAVGIPGGDNLRIAWRGVNGDLWVSGPTGGTDLGLAMAPNTSPSLIAFPDGNWEAAFQGANGKLFVTGSRYGTNGGGQAMAPGTSPSIGVDPTVIDAFRESWHGANNDLWVAGDSRPATDLGLPMAPGTSPSLAAL